MPRKLKRQRLKLRVTASDRRYKAEAAVMEKLLNRPDVLEQVEDGVRQAFEEFLLSGVRTMLFGEKKCSGKS